MRDVEGNRYIDLVQSYGAVLLGHAHPAVTAAVADGGGARHHVRRADARRGPPGRGDLRAGARLRAGAPGLLGDRGGHERGAPGPRRDRARPRGQVRRLLPRPLRRLAGRWRQRRGHARPAGLGRRLGRRGGRHRGRPLQRGAGARRAGGVRHRRAGGGQHEPGRAGARVPRRAARRLRRRRRAPRLRRGHHRLPPGRGRRDRMVGRDARPVVLRQGDRRRAAGRRLRRTPRADGRAGAGRPGVPGGHPVGEPAGHGGRAGRARRGGSGGLRGAERRAPRCSPRISSRRCPRAAWPSSVPAVGPLVGLFLGPGGRGADRRRRPTTRGPGRWPATAPTAASSTPCSGGAWRSRPAPTR